MVRRILRNGIPHTLLVGTESGTGTLENSLAAAYTKLNVHSPYDPRFTLSGIYQKTKNLRLQENLYSNVQSGFIHIITQNTGKQPKCPAIGEWLNKPGPSLRWNTA